MQKDNQGSSIVESVIAMALFSILISTIFVFSMNGIVSLERSSHYTMALQYLEEAEEVLYYIASDDFANIDIASSSLLDTGSTWDFLPEGQVETMGDYERSISVIAVFRDASGNIVDVSAPGAIEDAKSKFADIKVLWQVAGQRDIALNKRVLLVDL